jgi:signal transduction protein with GAF and PtsI domain
MKIKLKKVERLQEELIKLMTEKEVLFSAKYKVKQVLNKLEKPIENLNATILELYKKFGVEDKENKGQFKIEVKNVDKANVELKKLLDIRQ